MFAGKKTILVILGLVLFLGCGKTSDDEGAVSLPRGPLIINIECYTDRLYLWAETEGEEKQSPRDYNNLRINLKLERLDYKDSIPYYYPSTFLRPEQWKLSAENDKEMIDFYTELSAKSFNSFRSIQKGHSKYALAFLEVPYAGISGNPLITADRILFGIPPGGDLSNYFSVTQMNFNAQYILSYPNLLCQYFYGDKDVSEPMLFKEMYSEGIALPLGCQLAFSKQPIELYQYNYLTLKIEIPIRALSTFSFCDDFEEGGNPEVETVLAGEITIDLTRAQ